MQATFGEYVIPKNIIAENTNRANELCGGSATINLPAKHASARRRSSASTRLGSIIKPSAAASTSGCLSVSPVISMVGIERPARAPRDFLRGGSAAAPNASYPQSSSMISYIWRRLKLSSLRRASGPQAPIGTPG
jgi:hypothetical protein